MKKKQTYGEAVAELEKLLSSIENPDSPLEKVAEDVKKAKALIEMCRKMLRESEEKILAE